MAHIRNKIIADNRKPVVRNIVKACLPGRELETGLGKALHEIFESVGVTFSQGVLNAVIGGSQHLGGHENFSKLNRALDALIEKYQSNSQALALLESVDRRVFTRAWAEGIQEEQGLALSPVSKTTLAPLANIATLSLPGNAQFVLMAGLGMLVFRSLEGSGSQTFTPQGAVVTSIACTNNGNQLVAELMFGPPADGHPVAQYAYTDSFLQQGFTALMHIVGDKEVPLMLIPSGYYPQEWSTEIIDLGKNFFRMTTIFTT